MARHPRPVEPLCRDAAPWNQWQPENIEGTQQQESAMSAEPSNPKRDPGPNSNTEKPVEDWTTGDEPMTGAQASYLKTLSEEAGEPFEPDLTKAEASKRIDALQAKTGRGRS
jgi:hypothetical protein